MTVYAPEVSFVKKVFDLYNIVNIFSSSTFRDKVLRSAPYSFLCLESPVQFSFTRRYSSHAARPEVATLKNSADQEDLSRDLRPGLAVPVQPLIGQSSSWKQPGAPDC